MPRFLHRTPLHDTFSLPTRQIQMLGQGPHVSHYDALGIPLASILDVSGTACQFPPVTCIVSSQETCSFRSYRAYRDTAYSVFSKSTLVFQKYLVRIRKDCGLG